MKKSKSSTPSSPAPVEKGEETKKEATAKASTPRRRKSTGPTGKKAEPRTSPAKARPARARKKEKVVLPSGGDPSTTSDSDTTSSESAPVAQDPAPVSKVAAPVAATGPALRPVTGIVPTRHVSSPFSIPMILERLTTGKSTGPALADIMAVVADLVCDVAADRQDPSEEDSIVRDLIQGVTGNLFELSSLLGVTNVLRPVTMDEKNVFPARIQLIVDAKPDLAPRTRDLVYDLTLTAFYATHAVLIRSVV